MDERHKPPENLGRLHSLGTNNTQRPDRAHVGVQTNDQFIAVHKLLSVVASLVALRSNSGLLHCRRIFYHLSLQVLKASPDI